MSHSLFQACPQADLLSHIEAATFDAVPPLSLVSLGPWLVGLDPGTVSRAHSAAPVRLEPILIDTLPEVHSLYRGASLTPCLRLPDLPRLEPLRQHLQSLGYQASAATWVQHADCTTVLMHLGGPDMASTGVMTDPRRMSHPVQLRVEETADDAWCELFLGDGFDPVDGASRTTILRRARHARYASVVSEGQVVAVGMGSYSQGWASIHGMRTHPTWRGQGLARALIGELVRRAVNLRLPRVFLQVEASNAAAHQLYCRIGFENLWTYRYWRPKDAT
jgi:ribosomal protein S18 acetylase RimI-like enzyme